MPAGGFPGERWDKRVRSDDPRGAGRLRRRRARDRNWAATGARAAYSTRRNAGTPPREARTRRARDRNWAATGARAAYSTRRNAGTPPREARTRHERRWL